MGRIPEYLEHLIGTEKELVKALQYLEISSTYYRNVSECLTTIRGLLWPFRDMVDEMKKESP